jgi:hypothetical protein
MRIHHNLFLDFRIREKFKKKIITHIHTGMSVIMTSYSLGGFIAIPLQGRMAASRGGSVEIGAVSASSGGSV